MKASKIARSGITAAVAAMVACLTVTAQDNGQLLSKLSVPDGQGGARITVVESGEAASIIRMAAASRRSSAINAYRVRIFFDNSQNARTMATATLNRFREMYPDIAADMKYEAPNFRVTVGYCLTKEEQIMLWGRIKDAFPKAFLIPEPENISLETFLQYGGAPTDATSPEEDAGNGE